MTDILPRFHISSRVVFVITFGLALIFVLYTGRVWEDYYITYRVAKNLALGHGLVYTIGERVHAFTSPLGTLLPALGSLLTFNSSDLAALWIFRVMSITALAGAVTLVLATAHSLGWRRLSCVILIGWLITDDKSLDFSTNGMETGLLLFFLAYAMWAFFSCRQPGRWLHLGLAWAGLMWTRPDGFIYIAALTMGTLVFNDAARTGLTRRQWLGLLALAGLVCAAIYLPWFIGAWIYYGTPIPHTVIAKSGSAPLKTTWGALQALVRFPISCFTGNLASDGVFNPSYYAFGGWPDALRLLARGAAGAGAFLWAIPRVKREARAASFACLLVMVYLSYYPAYVAPWYLPGPAWLAYFALGGALETLLAALRQRSRWLAAAPVAVATAWLACSVWITFQAARQAAVEQAVIDDGSRRAIGIWLREHAAPKDRVFLECLGYIGFYSELKTYDFPGLSSPEVVGVIRKSDTKWSGIISSLRPEWLVLRPGEVMAISTDNGSLLRVDYELARVFDVTDALKQSSVKGRGLLAYDSVFFIFHRSDAILASPASLAIGENASGFPPEHPDAMDESILRLKKELEVWPQSPSLLNTLGGAHLLQGQVDKAIACFEKAVQIQPDLAESHYNAALALVSTGRYRAALPHFKKSAALWPDKAFVHANLGAVYVRLGDLPDAISQYEEALRLTPENWMALKNLAWLLATTSDASFRNGAKALSLAQKADALSDHQDPACLSTLAAAYAETGLFSEAIETATRAMQIAKIQNNDQAADSARKNLKLYQAHVALRDRQEQRTRPQ